MATRFSDKIRLRDFIALTVSEYLEGCEMAEKEHPGWRCGPATINTRQALRPGTEPDGTVHLWVDNDESSRVDRSEIPINIIRLPEGGS